MRSATHVVCLLLSLAAVACSSPNPGADFVDTDGTAPPQQTSCAPDPAGVPVGVTALDDVGVGGTPVDDVSGGGVPADDVSGGGGVPSDDVDGGGDCIAWDCATYDDGAGGVEVTCTAANPGDLPPGAYSCEEDDVGPRDCPTDSGGNGPFQCVATDGVVVCTTDDDGPGDGSGEDFGAPFPGGGTSGADAPLPGGETECYFDVADPTATQPSAIVEHVVETALGVDAVHVRVTLDPAFVDNTYGVNAIGWNPRKGHTFEMLHKSDHVEMVLTDAAGATAMQFKVDYVSVDASAPSGFRNLGVTGGDGLMIVGDAANVVSTMTSIDRNLNERGFAAFTIDSPATDAAYSPNPATPTWDYRVVYEAFVSLDAFSGGGGFGTARIDFIHASPSKGESTVIVEPRPCPVQ